jgi:hypothetical protein
MMVILGSLSHAKVIRGELSTRDPRFPLLAVASQEVYTVYLPPVQRVEWEVMV